jgi:hypothetical protein
MVWVLKVKAQFAAAATLIAAISKSKKPGDQYWIGP